MISIKLYKDNEEKTYSVPFVTARMVRRVLEVSKHFKDNMSEKDLDKVIDFVCEVFKAQFNRDDVYDGIKSTELITEITRIVNEVQGVDDPNIIPGEK